MGPRSQYLETVLTCKGDFYSPDFHRQLSVFRERLQQLIFLAEDERNLILKKVEPWNSVRVTFNIPADAAHRLRELAERRDKILRDLGVLAVQIDGDHVISLTIGSSDSKAVESKVSDNARSEIPPPPPSDRATVVPTSSGMSVEHLTAVGQEHGTVMRVPVTPVESAAERREGTITAGSVVLTPTKIARPPVSDGQTPSEIFVSGADRTVSWIPGLAQWPDSRAAATVVVSARHPNVGNAMPLNHGVSAVTVALPSFSPVDATTMAAAVQLAQSKMLQGACQNIASSSPLLVNLLQTKRGVCGQPNGSSSVSAQPSSSTHFDSSGAMLPPPPKRRRNQTRKPKLPTYNEVQLASTVQPTGIISLPQQNPVAESVSFPPAPVQIGVGVQQSVETNEPTVSAPSDTCSTCDDGSSGTPRLLINPYTGNMEVVELADHEDLNSSSRVIPDNTVPPNSSQVLPVTSSLNPKVVLTGDCGKPAVHTSATTLPVSLESPKTSFSLPASTNKASVEGFSVADFCARFGIHAVPAESGVSMQKNVLNAPVPGVSIPVTSIVSLSSVSTTCAGLVSEQKAVVTCASDAGMVHPGGSDLGSVVESGANNGIQDIQRLELNVISSGKPVLPVSSVGSLKIEQADNRIVIPMNIGCQPNAVNCPNFIPVPAPSVPFRPAIQLVRPATNVSACTLYPAASFQSVKTEIGETLNAASAEQAISCVSLASVAQPLASSSGASAVNAAVSNDELMRLAINFVKQNGRVLPVDDLNKTNSAVNISTASQSVPCLPGQSLPNRSTSDSTPIDSNPSLVNIVKTGKSVLSTTVQSAAGVAVSSDNCFFPAVSCFPPEHRRRTDGRLVAIGGIVESQNRGAGVSSLAGTMPPVRLSTSDMPSTPLLSGSWLTASSGLTSDAKSFLPCSSTAVSSQSAASLTNQVALQTGPPDDKRQLPVQATAVSTSMFTFGLRNEALQQLIPRLFPVSVVSSASMAGIQNLHVMARPPAVIGTDGKLATAAGDQNVSGLYRLPVSGEHNASSDKPSENSSTFGTPQLIPPAVDAASKVRAAMMGKSIKPVGVKDRRGGLSKTAEDVGLQRSSSKSHLTVAQLLERAKNARLTQVTNNEDSAATGESSVESHVAVSAVTLEVPHATNSRSPSDVSVPAADTVTKAFADQVRSCSNAFAFSSMPTGLSAPPPSSLPSALSTAPPLPPPPSLAHIMPVTAFAVPQQLPITSPRYPLNLTESVKKAMRGIGFYPSPPASPTAAVGRSITISKPVAAFNDSTTVVCGVKTLENSGISLGEQAVISEILDELSTNETVSKVKSTVAEECNVEAIGSCNMLISSAVDSAQSVLLETVKDVPEKADCVVDATAPPTLCSLPDLIVSTTGGIASNLRTAEVDSSPPADVLSTKEDVADRALDNHVEGVPAVAEKHDCEMANTSCTDAVCGALPDPQTTPDISFCDVPVAASDESDLTRNMNENPSQTLTSSSVESRLEGPQTSLDASECKCAAADSGPVQDLLQQPMQSTNASANENAATGTSLDVRTISSDPDYDNAVVGGSTVEEDSSSNSVCTVESLDECVLVNGDITVPAASEPSDVSDCPLPEMAPVGAHGGPSDPSPAAATLEEQPTASALVSRPSTRRSKTVQNCAPVTSNNAASSAQPPTAAALPAVTRMTTRSSNRITAPVAVSDAGAAVATDAVSSSVKLATRRTPSKTNEGQPCPVPVVETSTAATTQETEIAASSNRRSVRAPRVVPCVVEGKKPEPHTATGVDGATTGVSLRSRAKVTQLATTPSKAAVNSLATKRTVTKNASMRQSDLLLENCSPDLVARANENYAKCDLNGSDDVS